MRKRKLTKWAELPRMGLHSSQARLLLPMGTKPLPGVKVMTYLPPTMPTPYLVTSSHRCVSVSKLAT